MDHAAKILQLHRKSLESLAIADLLEDLEFEGKISHVEKEERYLQYAKDYGLTDLLPRILKPDIAGANMSTRSMILTKEPGKTIDPALAKLIPDVYKETMGYALIMSEAGKPKMYIGSGLAPAQLGEYLGVTEDSPAIFVFGNAIVKDDSQKQPYNLLTNNEGNPDLVAFVEGDYPDYHEADGSFDTTNFIKNYLQPKIDELYEMVDQDLDRLLAALQKPMTAADINSKHSGRGVVTFMASNGVSFSIEQNDKRKDFEWGSVSMVEGAYPAESDVQLPLDKPAEVKSTGNPLQDRLNAQKAKAAAAAAGKPEGVHETKASPTVLNGGGTSVPATSQKVYVFAPEKACKDKSSLNNWYMKGWGFLPPKFEEGVGVPDRATPMPLDTIKPGVNKDGRYQIRGTLASRGRATSNVEPSAAVTAAALPVAPGTTAGGFPVIPSGQKEVVTTFLKTIDLKSQTIGDPAQLAEIEKKASMFFNQYPDIDPTAFILGCPIERLEELALKWPESFKLLAYTLRHYAAIYSLNMRKLKSSEETTHELAKGELKPTGNPLQDRLNAQKARGAAA